MSCHRCGVAQSSKFCRTCGVKIVRGESCPGCNQEVPIQTSEKVVQGGKEWHKPCFEKAFPAKGPSAGFKGNFATCPGCQQVLKTGEETGNRTIHQGAEWHKSCYEKAFPSKGPSQGFKGNYSLCPGCEQVLKTGEDTGSRTIQGGVEWHRKCWEDKQAPEVFCDNCGRKGRQGSKCSGCSTIIS
eukprot:TRINITY_DN354_c0_g1_i1.p1 TRINITY_DN354_c0_g1~~TRINITY_DN354_c0_g1_i1.p1  ORF type:complete len:198 (-),score=45.97 TRINITY_DN354_c0_g1_i1:165-719(-)